MNPHLLTSGGPGGGAPWSRGMAALLNGGADPCLRDRDGKFAYDHAADEIFLAI